MPGKVLQDPAAWKWVLHMTLNGSNWVPSGPTAGQEGYLKNIRLGKEDTVPLS